MSLEELESQIWLQFMTLWHRDTCVPSDHFVEGEEWNDFLLTALSRVGVGSLSLAQLHAAVTGVGGRIRIVIEKAEVAKP